MKKNSVETATEIFNGINTIIKEHDCGHAQVLMRTRSEDVGQKSYLYIYAYLISLEPEDVKENVVSWVEGAYGDEIKKVDETSNTVTYELAKVDVTRGY